MRPPRHFLGRDPRSLELLEILDRIAPTEAPVLLLGETGTGKDLLALELHARSERRGGPFIAVNCGALPPNLEDSELFGHVAGAFTGAAGRRRGHFECAHGGTLFLDELAELPKHVQVKLLRVLQTGEVMPVGSSASARFDVRIVAATHENLGLRIEQGVFRADLFHRLDVFSLEVPPLRERRGDVLPLASFFLGQLAARYRRPAPEMSPDLCEWLLAYDFPGNVRELENLLHRAFVLGGERLLGLRAIGLARRPAAAMPAGLPAAGDSAALDFHQAKQAAVEQFERDYLVQKLRESGGIVSRAATRAGLSERLFHEKLNRYGIDGQSFRGARA